MNDTDPACERVRPLLHEAMDREPTADVRRDVDAHLATCADCREIAAGLDTVRETLSSLPEAAFPDDALREVFARTVDAEPWWRSWLPSTGWRVALTGAAAMALAGAALWTAWNGTASRPDPTVDVAVNSTEREAELRQALEETRFALALASNAVRRSGRVAVEDVLRKSVAPALDRIPVRFPTADEGTRRNGA